MPICYNGRTKKRAVTCSLYGLCIVHSPNFLSQFAIISVLNPLGLTISLANLAGVFMPKKERGYFCSPFPLKSWRLYKSLKLTLKHLKYAAR